MEFFKELSAMLQPGITVNFTAVIKDGQMTVGVVPSSKDNNIPMLMLNGTPEEIDEGFFNTIKEPLEKASGFISNANQVVEQIEKTEKKEKVEPSAKKDEKKTTTAKKSATKKPASDSSKEDANDTDTEDIEEKPTQASMF